MGRLRVAEIFHDETGLPDGEILLFLVVDAQVVEGCPQLVAARNHPAQGAHGFHGRAVGEVLEGEGTAIHITSFFLGWNVKGKIFLNHIVIFIAIFMLIGGNLRSRKRDMDGQEWVFVTLVTLHIITL